MKEQQKIESSDMTLMELITKANYVFKIPNYQRNYVWTEKEVWLFLKDGEYCWRKQQEEKVSFEHFAGQVILRKIKEKNALCIQMEIIDGQQRLTTFLLLVSVACRMMRGISGGKTVSDDMEELYLICKSQYEEEKRLCLSNVDQHFWECLSNPEIDPKECKPKVESHKNLKKAVSLIQEYLNELTKDLEEENVCETLKSYVEDLAKSFRFVLLKTNKPGYMYALYQIVNDRGLPLTSGELLKARTIELLESNAIYSERAENIWDDILADEGKVTERYLGWNYAAVLGEKMEARGTMSIQEQYERKIFKCYHKREILELEQKEIMDQLEQLYSNVNYMRVLEKGALPIDKLNNYTSVVFEALIKGLHNMFCIPVYLKILDMKENVMLKTAENLTPMLAKAFFIAKTMGGLHDDSISKCYLDIMKYINHSRADMENIKVRLEKLVKKENCKKVFESKLDQDIYVHGPAGNAKIKFMLMMLEFYYCHKAEGNCKQFADDAFNLHFSQTSIEHILDDNVDPREVRKEFYEKRQRIGNLTLIGRRLNTRLRDKCFEEKKPVYSASPFVITRKVGKLERWRYQEFQERQKELIEDLKLTFEL